MCKYIRKGRGQTNSLLPTPYQTPICVVSTWPMKRFQAILWQWHVTGMQTPLITFGMELPGSTVALLDSLQVIPAVG